MICSCFRNVMAQEGFEPSASLVLSESGLPVAYRADFSSGGWNRTSGLHVQSVASLPAATAPESVRRIREEGFEPPPPDSKSGSLPVSRFPSESALRESNPPVRLGKPVPGRSARDAVSIVESGIGDSNPGRLVGSQESCRWTNPAASSIIAAEGEGVEPSRLIARLISNQVPSPIGLPFR